MSVARQLLWGLVFLGVIVGFPAIAQTTQPDVAPMTQAPELSAPGVRGIASATDPSSAIAAYADASRIAPGDGAVESAFMRKMVDFGLPMLAEVQAKELNQRDPQNGLAWAVTAYANAKRGEPELAIAQIEIAVERAPDDPFVQRTAGQLMAWYDASVPTPALPDVILKDLPKLRDKVSNSENFKDAYRLASAEYNRDDEPAQVSTSQPPIAPATQPEDVRIIRPNTTAPPSDYVTYYDQGNPYTTNGYPTNYYAPVVYAPTNFYPNYGWWDSYWPGGWWWFGGSVIVVRDCFKGGRKFDCFNKSNFCDNRFGRFGGFNRSSGRFASTNRGSSGRGDGSVRVTSTGESGRFVGPVQRRSTFVGPVQQSSNSSARSREPARVVGPAQQQNRLAQQNRFVGPVQQQNRFVGPVQQPAASSKSGSARSSGRPSQSTFVGPVQNPAPRSASAAKGNSSRSAPAKVSGSRGGGNKSSASASRGGGGKGNASASRGGGSSGGRSSAASGSRGGGGGARGGGGGNRGGGRGR